MKSRWPLIDDAYFGVVRVGLVYAEELVEDGVLVVANGQVRVEDVVHGQVALTHVDYLHERTHSHILL